MGKGAKIAIGCGIAAILAVIVLIGAVVGLGYWGKRKLESGGASIEELGKLSELKRQTAAMPFTPPADGVVTEPQLLKFLEVRKAIYPIYEQNRSAIEALRGVKKPGFGDAMKAGAIFANIQLARAKAQVAQGLGDAEYAWLAQAIYKTRWAAAAGAEPGTQLGVPAENVALFQRYREQIDLYSMAGLEFAGM